jgi:hypothetical protein
MSSLSDARIKELYANFDEGRGAGWEKWLADATAHLEWAQALTDAELREPEIQRRLWTETGLGGVGSADNLPITQLPGDPALTELYLSVRHEALPPDASPRAQRLEALYAAIRNRAQGLLPGNMPHTRLRRLMLSLRPSDLHCAFTEDSLSNARELLVGRKVNGQVEGACLARARLREVLGEEADLRAHAVRATFCWWLHDQRGKLEGHGATKPEPTWTGERIYQLWQSDLAQAAYCEGLAETTISTYRQAVNSVLTALRASHGDQPVDLEADVLRAITQQWSRGATPQTVNGYRLKWNRWAHIANTLGLPLRPLSSQQLPFLDEVAPATPVEPTLAELRARFQADNDAGKLIFPPAMVRGLYAAWSFHARKRFALLSGLSGTGKTELLKHTARLTCEHMGLDENNHVALIAVNPDWRDPSGLLGHLSTLHSTPTFHAEAALRLVLRAANDPGRPYFLLLDEMNLAPVERYFAPFLSAMESGADLLLHGEDDEVNGVPPRVAWPSNLRIGGTVNMDETTYPFSDKVLDRAFTFEFWEVDIEGLFEARGTERATEAAAQAALRALQAQLVPIRRHVGYRALTEALDWIAACHQHDPEAPISELIDEAVFAKVLPRLRGSESTALSTALAQIQQTCVEHNLSRCQAKVQQMAARLTETGVTGFWS